MLKTRITELLVKYPIIAAPMAYQSGDTDNAMVSVGQGVGLIHDIRGVKEIIDSIVTDAGVIMQRLNDIGFPG